jgi:hypothetical protein
MDRLTLAEWTKRIDKNGKAAKIAELLLQSNDILEDAVFLEANEVTHHRTTVRTGLPSPTWRKLNYGVQSTVSSTKQVDDVIGMLEARSEIDEKQARLGGDVKGQREIEDSAHIESMGQTMAQTLIYGDTDVDPEKFLGLAARYPYTDTPNVVNAGGSGDDLTSIYIVNWSPNTVFGTFPKGSKAGLVHNDKGLEAIADSAGGKFYAYVSQYQWDMGLVVRDWRYVVRVCNIETSGSSNIIDADLIMDAMNTLPMNRMGKTAIYANKVAIGQIRKAAYNNSLLSLSVDEAFGGPVYKIWGIPIRQVDQILNTESALTASS